MNGYAVVIVPLAIIAIGFVLSLASQSILGGLLMRSDRRTRDKARP